MSPACPDDNDAPFIVAADPPASNAPTRLFRVRGRSIDTGAMIERTYALPGTHQNDYLDFYARLAGDFGTLVPANRRSPTTPSFSVPYQVLLTENVAPGILYGYGDPAVIRIDDPDQPAPVYYLLATSNDAPDAFPILRTSDLVAWEHVGFVFPAGRKPGWAADGEHVSDYWAAEMHRVAGRYLVVFTARKKNGELAIGLARADRPEGPFVAADVPLLAGGVIDAHVLVTSHNEVYLYWKEDTNAVWPSRLTELLVARGDLVEVLFSDAAARTAHFLRAIGSWVATLRPMEQFSLQQLLIEAVIEEFSSFRERLRQVADTLEEPAQSVAYAALDAMRTRIFGQRLSPDDSCLVGERRVILENDKEWEGHLVEGVWISEQQGRYFCFYAANDFATANYGIGVAVGDAPLGPFHKIDDPLLRSCANWSGPGHPSVATGPDGRPMLFLHAFLPGTGGYKVFRALLAAPLRFERDRVEVG